MGQVWCIETLEDDYGQINKGEKGKCWFAVLK